MMEITYSHKKILYCPLPENKISILTLSLPLFKLAYYFLYLKECEMHKMFMHI